MFPRKWLLLIAGVLIAGGLYSQSVPEQHFDGKTWWEQVKVLADDKMEGRDTGSAGLRKAEAYAVEQLKQAGLEPAGTKGFYQPMQFVSRRMVESESSAALVRDGKAEPLALGEDLMFSTRVELAPEVNAGLVFVGYGLKIPENNHDDLAGLDLKGKVVVLITGSPAEVPSALSAHYQSAAERWKPMREAGVVGVITLLNPGSMDVPWSRITMNRNHPAMDLDYPEFNETAGEKLAMYFNPAHAEKLFAGSGHTFQEMAELAKDRKPLPRFPLAVSIRAKTKLEKKRVESANVVAKLPGSDAKLKDEYVVLSAHIDHIGVGEPINGDRINNGAMDDASGTAALLDLAAALKKTGTRFKRSLLLVLVTAEEKGLLGSKYYAAHPTVDARAMVANINTDMFLPIVPLKVLTVYGLAESDLGDAVREVAEAEGVKVQADPMPLRNIFIRSDQYNFVKRGVPALMIDVAPDPNSAEQKQLYRDWIVNRYHAPADDLNQPVNLESAGKYEDVILKLTAKVANDAKRPEWKADSFFKRYAQRE